MILFIIMTITALTCAYIADKKNSKLALFVCISVIAAFSACRGSSVGIDTAHYYVTYWGLYDGAYVNFNDLIYGITAKWLVMLLKNPAGVIFIFSGMTNILILSRLWKLRERASFTFMVFVYLAGFYTKSMNIMRQYLAVAIVFWAVSFLEEKKYVKFLIAQIIASGIHMASTIGFLICFLYLLNDAKENRKKSRLLGELLIASVVFIVILLRYFDYDKYAHYFAESTFNFALITVYKLLLIAFIWFTTRYSMNKNEFSYNAEGELIPFDNLQLTLYFGGTLLSVFGMAFAYMGRVGLVLTAFEMPTLGQVVQSKKYKLLFELLCIAPFIYLYIMALIKDGNGIFPYVTFWNS